ncbi:MAG: hypothetical protein KJO15_17395 [Alphaproteobacteria bacterium]|nr:hypothetical protein [Alphaproteobacteria bacterium]
MKTPWHLWVVSILAVLWNGFGAVDYVMTQTRNPTWLAQFPPEQVAYFDTYPTWVQACWAVAIWSSVLASLFLLFRRAISAQLFLVSILFLALAALYNFGLAEVTLVEAVGPTVVYFWAAIGAVAVFLWLYSRIMSARDYLM